MSKIKPTIVRNPADLAAALNLSPSDAVDLEIRARLNDKIIAAVQESARTHAEVAESAGTSRSRLTAILNRDRSHVSADLLLRILLTLGYRAHVTFRKSRSAA